MDDCAKNAPSGFVASGDRIGLIGGVGRGHLGGSEYAKAVHGRVAGMPPPLDYALEKAAQAAVRGLVRKGLARSAHDCSEGGLAVALAEMCFPRDLGCKVALDTGALPPAAALFGEDQSRILVAYKAADAAKVAAHCASVKAPFTEIGEVGGAALIVRGLLDVPLAGLKSAWTGALPALVGEGVHAVALEGHAGAP